MSMAPREPFDAFTPLREAVSRFIDESVVNPDRLFMLGRSFPIDVLETKDEFVIEASLFGIRPQDIDITSAGNTVTIRAGHKMTHRREDGTYIRKERFERPAPELLRTVTLPAKVNPEKVNAAYEHGILSIHIAKDEESKPKSIPVHVAKELAHAH